MEYNTQKAPVRMKAYGREVQLMVEHALTLSDRAERTAYAARIVETMRIVSRQPADSREVNEKIVEPPRPTHRLRARHRLARGGGSRTHRRTSRSV